MQNLVYIFSKFLQFKLELTHIWRGEVLILVKIWPQNQEIGIWIGYTFMKNWYVWVHFQIVSDMSLPKLNFSTPKLTSLFRFAVFQFLPLLCFVITCFEQIVMLEWFVGKSKLRYGFVLMMMMMMMMTMTTVMTTTIQA